MHYSAGDVVRVFVNVLVSMEFVITDFNPVINEYASYPVTRLMHPRSLTRRGEEVCEFDLIVDDYYYISVWGHSQIHPHQIINKVEDISFDKKTVDLILKLTDEWIISQEDGDADVSFDYTHKSVCTVQRSLLNSPTLITTGLPVIEIDDFRRGRQMAITSNLNKIAETSLRFFKEEVCDEGRTLIRLLKKKFSDDENVSNVTDFSSVKEIIRIRDRLASLMWDENYAMEFVACVKRGEIEQVDRVVELITAL